MENLMDIKIGGGSGQEVAYSIYPFRDKYYVGGYWQSSDFQSDTLLFTNAISNNSIIIEQNLNGESLSGFKIINGATGNVTLKLLAT
jgi:acetate kinase